LNSKLDDKMEEMKLCEKNAELYQKMHPMTRNALLVAKMGLIRQNFREN